VKGRAAAGGARQRILATAARLFYRHGIRAVGVDRIIREAQVAKATFYKHFPSKDDLVLAWLRDRESHWLHWIQEELDRREELPEARLLALFDLLGEWIERPGFRGCPFVNAAAEVADPDHPVVEEVRRFRREVEDFLARTAAGAGFHRPERLAAQLSLLVSGTFVAATATGSAAPAAIARAAAEAVLARAPRAPAPRL
jgi:AcrR family transcriptional regulator